MAEFLEERLHGPLVCDYCGCTVRRAVTDFPQGESQVMCFDCKDAWEDARPFSCVRDGLPMIEVAFAKWTPWPLSEEDRKRDMVMECPNGHVYLCKRAAAVAGLKGA